MKRDKFPTKSILLRSQHQLELACKTLMLSPIDEWHPLEFVVREQVKARTPDQNARMWAGPLRDIEAQAYIGGRTYRAEVWHEQFKKEYLPENDDPDLQFLAKDHEKYVKWDITPGGDRVCIGSTTQLSPRGFAEYMDKIYAYGASIGVQFSLSPREVSCLQENGK